MAVKSITLNGSLYHHFTAVRLPASHSLPHPPHLDAVPPCALHPTRSAANNSGENPSKWSKERQSRWQAIRDGLRSRATQTYQQLVQVKELTRTVSWNLPGISLTQNIRDRCITVVQPPTKSQVLTTEVTTKASITSGDSHPGPNSSGSSRTTKSMKHVRGKPPKKLSGKPGISNNLNGFENTQDGAKHPLSNEGNDSSDPQVPGPITLKEEQTAGSTLQSQETEALSSNASTSGFMNRIFDVESLLKRIQGQLQTLEGLRASDALEGGEQKPSVADAERQSKKGMQYSEEFETGSQGEVYGDVIIQFRPKRQERPLNLEQEKNDTREMSSARKSDAASDAPSNEHDAGVSKIFRDNLDEWYRERYQEVGAVVADIEAENDPRGDISQRVSSSFFKTDNLTSVLKSIELPALSGSIQRINRRFTKDQACPSPNIHEPSTVEADRKGGAIGSYFDTNSPLLEMTKAMGEMPHGISRQPLELGRGKGEELKTTSTDTNGKDKEAEIRERRSKVQVAQSSIKARARSLSSAVSKQSSMVSKLMNLQRLCTHLSEYPETRDIAVQENLIPILLRLRERPVEAKLDGEIRRALALMGFADPVKKKGIRILSIDGGGSRGVIPIEVLRRLEESCEQKIGHMFDYVIGVSSGAVLGFLLAIPKVELDECERLYREMSVEVFGQNKFAGTRNLVLNHSYYDTEGWMNLLRNHLHGKGEMPISETARDPTCPKLASVATIMNVGTLRDYLFRNYNLPPGTRSFYQGSSKYRLWEALRASSAAPGYFEEFKLDDHIFQDGGVLTNNPCALAVHECRLLWPDTPIQCVVSVGTGRYEPVDQEFPVEYSSLKTKLFKVLCSATDTEAAHTILKDLLPSGTYFRFNPTLSEDFLLDENRPEVLAKMQEEARGYLNRNELKLMQATGVLTREKSTLDRISDWVTLKKNMRIPRRKKSSQT